MLLVDDEPALLRTLPWMLGGTCTLYTAQDAERALELANALPDLAVVVSDLRLPGASGVQFLQQIRKLLPSAVRVLITGYANRDHLTADIDDAEIFRLLRKPLATDVLQECLQEALTEHRRVAARSGTCGCG